MAMPVPSGMDHCVITGLIEIVETVLFWEDISTGWTALSLKAFNLFGFDIGLKFCCFQLLFFSVYYKD